MKIAAVMPAATALGSGAVVAPKASAQSSGSGTCAAPHANPASVGQVMIITDMNGLGPGGKPTGKPATLSSASKEGATADTAGSKMKLTDEGQAILDGKDGEEKAKLVKTMVKFGEVFGAEKMVELGGAPHSNLYIGAPYMSAIIDLLQGCADARLKPCAP